MIGIQPEKKFKCRECGNSSEWPATARQHPFTYQQVPFFFVSCWTNDNCSSCRYKLDEPLHRSPVILQRRITSHKTMAQIPDKQQSRLEPFTGREWVLILVSIGTSIQNIRSAKDTKSLYRLKSSLQQFGVVVLVPAARLPQLDPAGSIVHLKMGAAATSLGSLTKYPKEGDFYKASAVI